MLYVFFSLVPEKQRGMGDIVKFSLTLCFLWYIVLVLIKYWNPIN